MAQKWEYYFVRRARTLMLGNLGKWDLNIVEEKKKLGEAGWELVAVSATASSVGDRSAGVTTEEVWALKRPKESITP
jgi:hypothetical protein